jgi:hypothetical protein
MYIERMAASYSNVKAAPQTATMGPYMQMVVQSIRIALE